MESAICDICNTNVFDVVRMERFTDFVIGDWYPVVTSLCRNCGHVFTNPRMTDIEWADFYNKQLRESYEVARGENNGLFEYEMDLITTTLGPGAGRRVLEVGCYTGYMLKRLSDAGWDVSGVEPNPLSAKRTQELFGFPVHVTTFEEFSASTKEQYDLIVMGSVLEHVNHPTQFLLNANSLLAQGGGLFVRVPDVEVLTLDTIADLFPLEHPNMYSATVLKTLFDKTGFSSKFLGNGSEFPRHLVGIGIKERAEAHPCTQSISSNYDKMSDLLGKYNRSVDQLRDSVAKALKSLYVPRRRKVAIYGAGNHTEFLLRYTDISKADIRFLVDTNPEKWNRTFLGLPVERPQRLMESSSEEVEVVVISSRAFQSEIYAKLKSLKKRGIDVIKLYETDANKL